MYNFAKCKKFVNALKKIEIKLKQFRKIKNI